MHVNLAVLISTQGAPKSGSLSYPNTHFTLESYAYLPVLYLLFSYGSVFAELAKSTQKVYGIPGLPDQSLLTLSGFQMVPDELAKMCLVDGTVYTLLSKILQLKNCW